MTVHCFTSVTYNYLPRASILGATLKKYNPDWAFHVVLSEPIDKTFPWATKPFDSLIGIDQLGVKNLSSWLFKHDVTETCTGVKGWAFEYIMKNYNAQKVIYLDPDIAVFNKLQELEVLLDRVPIILIPHQTEPNTKLEDHFHDNNFLRCGVYNLGFLALHKNGQGGEFLNWWREKIVEYCYDESPFGLFTDQRWCDLVPSFFDKAYILRDAGYNVAPWNISRRQMSRNTDGIYRANNFPLRFFHFSKYGAMDYERAARENSSNDPIVSELVDWYGKELEKNGQSELGSRIWFYDRFDNGERITRKMRRYYRENPEIADYFPDPFDTELEGGFLQWWKNNDLDNQIEESPYLEIPSDRPYKVSTEYIEQLYDKISCTIRNLSSRADRTDSSPPEVSIVIPRSDELAGTLECILSILNLDETIKYEIVIVANRFDNRFDSLLTLGGIKLIFVEEKTNLADICNRAARNASGDYLVFIDNLAKVQENWLHYLQKTFMDFPNTGLACSKLINPNTNKSAAGICLDQAEEISPIGNNTECNDPTIGHVQEVDFATTSIMIPKLIWQEIGGMNTNLPEYIAFLDLALKVYEAGYEVRNQPNSEVTLFRFSENFRSTSHYKKLYPDIFKQLKKKSLRRRLSPVGSVLYVDDRIPQPDKSAGGFYSLNCIRILKNLGFNVTFFPAWEQGYEAGYAKDLQSIGIETLYAPFISGLDRHIEERGYAYDLIILCRVSVVSYYLQKIKKYAPQAKIVFNTIDLHFLRLERFAEISGHPLDKQEAIDARKLELEAMGAGDATIVVSTVEQALLKTIAPSAKVFLIPIPVDIPGRLAGFDERRDIVFLGGYGHQPNVDAVKFFAKEIWPLLSPRLPGAKFIIAGSDMPEEFSSLATDTVELRGYIRDLGEFYSHCRLSIVPLRFGAGVKGKILTSMSYGVPNVVTSLAAEGMQLINDQEVLIADSPNDFANAVEKAYTQAQLWLKLSDNGLQYLERKASLEAVSRDFVKLLAFLNLIEDK